MKNEKLIRAMSEIDDDLIAEAHENKKPRILWVRWSALAACLAVVILCVPALLHGLGGVSKAEMDAATVGDKDLYYSPIENSAAEDVKQGVHGNISYEGVLDEIKDAIDGFMNGSGSNEKAEEIPECGEPLYSYTVGQTAQACGMTVAYVSADEISISFHVKKTDDRPFVLRITAEDGTGARTVLTEEDSEYFAITVNGEKVETLPDKAGEYDVTVDFSAILQDKGWQIDDRVIIGETAILIWEQGG